MKIIKICSSQGGLGKADGAEKAPDKIIEQIHDLFCSENGSNTCYDTDSVDVVQNDITETNNHIFEKAKQVIAEEKAIFLGGDHSITYSIVKAFSDVFSGKKNGILIFDAHPDAENDFNPPTQEDLLPAIVSEGLIDSQNIILVGTRNWHENEIEFLKEHNIRFFNMKEIFEKGVKSVVQELFDLVMGFDNLYVSVDIDVLDPAFAPGTGYSEPGGISTRELLYFLDKLKGTGRIKAMDLMEVNPDKDVNDLTSKAGAKIIMEMLDY